MTSAASRGIFLETDKLYEAYLSNTEHELGFLAVNERLRNNDSLAHVRQLIQNSDPEAVKPQIHAEFKSDIGERSGTATPERHFYKTWDYRLEGDALISDTGLSLRKLLLKGEEAAINDYGPGHYHAMRASLQTLHPDMLVRWRKSGDPRCVRLVSLCPESAELPTEVAKLGNFKPERGLASNWIFEPIPDGIRLHAFSQDNLTLSALEENDRQIGITDGDYTSSLAKLGQLDILPFTDGTAAVEAHKQVHDDNLTAETGRPHYFGIRNPITYEESIAAVEMNPVVWNMYWQAVNEVAESLVGKKVTKGLSELVMTLRKGFEPEDMPEALQIHWQRSISEGQARQLMDYLRERAIPQYVFGETTDYQALSRVDGAGYGSVAAAGAYAVENGIIHQGDCPSSPQNQNTNAEMAAALQVQSKQEFKSHWCPNCLKKPQAGKTVKAWRKGDKIGCYDCGREQDVCTGRIIKKGRAAEKLKKRAISGADIISSWLHKENQIRKIKKVAEQRAKAELGDNVTYLDVKRYEKRMLNT